MKYSQKNEIIRIRNIYFGFIELFFVYSYVHTIFGSILCPTPHPFPFPPLKVLLPGRNCSAHISNFVEEKV
jgi:hypothetical protein